MTKEERHIYNQLIEIANLGMEIQLDIDSYRKYMASYRDNRNQLHKNKADKQLWSANEKGSRYKKMFNELLKQLTDSKAGYAK